MSADPNPPNPDEDGAAAPQPELLVVVEAPHAELELSPGLFEEDPNPNPVDAGAAVLLTDGDAPNATVDEEPNANGAAGELAMPGLLNPPPGAFPKVEAGANELLALLFPNPELPVLKPELNPLVVPLPNRPDEDGVASKPAPNPEVGADVPPPNPDEDGAGALPNVDAFPNAAFVLLPNCAFDVPKEFEPNVDGGAAVPNPPPKPVLRDGLEPNPVGFVGTADAGGCEPNPLPKTLLGCCCCWPNPPKPDMMALPR